MEAAIIEAAAPECRYTAVKEKSAGPKASKSQTGFSTALAMALTQAFIMPQLYFDKFLLPLILPPQGS